MTDQPNFENETCEYGDCMETGTTYDENLKAWLCAKHEDSPNNSTGYCTRDCQLGHGCDGSC